MFTTHADAIDGRHAATAAAAAAVPAREVLMAGVKTRKWAVWPAADAEADDVRKSS